MVVAAFSRPAVSESINRLIYEWQDIELRVIADRVTDNGVAELWFYHMGNGHGDSLLHTAKVNLLSSATMGQIGKRMAHHSEETPWTQILTFITSNTMEYARRGEPGLVLEPGTEPLPHPGYFVEPFIMRGVPSVIYGDKGVHKTTTSLAMLGTVALGGSTNFGMSATEAVPVALLDWESSDALTAFTLGKLIQGKAIQPFKLPYLRCKMPLADDINRIANFLQEHRTKLALIDSLGQAAGSDKFDTSGKASALRFFECLRQLNVTSLIIAQNAKSNEESKKTIYGSTYFTYYSRNIFELRGKRDDLDSNQMHVAFFHQDSNYSKLYEPIGYRIEHSEQGITFSSESVSLSEFLEKASQTKQVLDALSGGAKNRTALAKELAISDKQIDVILNRLKKKQKVVSLGQGMWGLMVTGNEPNS